MNAGPFIPKNRASGRRQKLSPISEAAWRLLAYRARSSEELRRRLRAKGYEESAVVAEISRLQGMGHLDDAAFARTLVGERQRGSGARGSLALRSELRARGVERGVIEASLQPHDDERAAADAAARKAIALAGLPRATFERRLGAFLQRRGFNLETARGAVSAAWAQANGERAAIPKSTDFGPNNC